MGDEKNCVKFEVEDSDKQWENKFLDLFLGWSGYSECL